MKNFEANDVTLKIQFAIIKVSNILSNVLILSTFSGLYKKDATHLASFLFYIGGL